MPRKSSLEEKGITKEEIAEKYDEMENLEKTAYYFNISEKTVRKYLDQLGIQRHQGPRHAKSKEVPKWHYGCLATWIRNHPGQALPSKPKDIASTTGCTEAEVKMYLMRKRKWVKKHMKQLPQLFMFDKVLKDTKLTRVPTKAISHGYYTMNKRNYYVEYVATMKDGSVRKFAYPIEDWKKIFNFKEDE